MNSNVEFSIVSFFFEGSKTATTTCSVPLNFEALISAFVKKEETAGNGKR